MKRVAYIRVSTAEQRPARQIDGLMGMADKLFVETLSAVARRRPIYESVIASLEPGDTLVVWAVDRAFRNLRDALRELDALRARKIKFHIANIQLDMETADGRYHYAIMSANAEWERDKLSERTKEGIAAARARGKRIGRPPKLTERDLFDAHYRIATGVATRAQIADEYKIWPWSLTRALKRSARNSAH